MNRISLAFAACCLILSSAACDGGTTNTAGAGSNNIAIGNLQASLVDAVCASAVKCPGAFPFAFAAPSTCTTMFGAELTDIADLIAAVQAGKVTYDGAEAAKCIAAIRSSCAFFDQQKAPPGCAATFVGSAADGATCGRDEECKSAYCKSSSTPGCAGKCTAKVAAGAACNGNKECIGTLVCSGGKCVENVPAKKNELCEQLKCDAGLYCDHSTTPVCTDLITIGGKCNDSDACVAGAYCQAQNKSDPAVCTALGKAGSACSPQGLSQGISGCESGLVCAPDSKSVFSCVARAKLGEACTSTFQCGTIDTVCAASGKCEVLPGKGGACAPANKQSGQAFACLPPYACDPTAKQCVDAPGKDQACIDGECAKGLNCVSDKCKAPGAAGEACDPMMGLDCAKDLECDANKKCAAPVCK